MVRLLFLSKYEYHNVLIAVLLPKNIQNIFLKKSYIKSIIKLFIASQPKMTIIKAKNHDIIYPPIFFD